MAITANISVSVTLNVLKMAKTLSSEPKNQYIVLFNSLIIRSSLRTQSLRRYMTCWGNLSNYADFEMLGLDVNSRTVCHRQFRKLFFPSTQLHQCIYTQAIARTMQDQCFICCKH